MKHHQSESLLRWRDGQADGPSPEARAAALVRDTLAPEALPAGLDEQQLADIQRMVSVRLRTVRRPSLRLRLALAGGILFVGVASVMAYQAGWIVPRHPSRAPAPQPAPVPKARAKLAAPGASVSDLQAAVPEAPAPVEPAPIEAPRPRPARVHPRPVAEVAPESPSATSEEILALNRAVGLLRGQHDASSALQALDEYFRRFPAGVLNREARVARIDALLLLRRSDEALRALDALPLDAHGRSTELRLIRAELRSRQDCARAEADFAAVLTRAQSAEFAERALYGMGECRLKRGDNPGASEALRRYLARFPEGVHAGWARRWLANLNQEGQP